MPQPKWYGKSLSALCMDNIVLNMEKLTALRSLEHVSCHFYHMPSHCLEYVTECLLKDYSLTEDMFHLLLSPHLKVLDLSQYHLGTVCDANRNLRVFRLASDRCLQLTTLKLYENSVHFKERNFEVEDNFACSLQLFQHLQILDLTGTIYGARSMLKLGSTNKPKIRELIVDSCPGVTDTVVEVFCKGQSSLQKLSVYGTEVTHSGIRFAIEHLPELKELNCCNEGDKILKAFRSIRKETRESKKYSLTKHDMSTSYEVSYKKGSVSLMVDMCPSLASVHIFLGVNDEGFTNEELLGFRELKQLKNLTIVVSLSIMPFSIRGGVIPLLQARGHTLEELRLSMEVTSEEVYDIIECCPNVRRLLLDIKGMDLEPPELLFDSPWDPETPELVVDDRVHSSLCSPKEVFPLRMLDFISLRFYNFPRLAKYDISRKLLLLLLSSPTLTDIFIYQCLTLDDQIIEEACTKNSFKYLTKLKFRNCYNVSQEGIDFFLNEANPLSEIILDYCGDELNLKNMKTMAQEKHWKVKIKVKHEEAFHFPYEH